LAALNTGRELLVGASKLLVVTFELVVGSKDECFTLDEFNFVRTIGEESSTNFRSLGIKKNSFLLVSEFKTKNRMVII
jgi:hypothetical protein